MSEKSTSSNSNWFAWIKAKPKHTGIVYFDGVCSICNRFVDFLISNDKNNTLQYASLQGTTAKENIDPKFLQSLSTVVYQENGKTYSELSAILKAISSLGGIWKLTLIFRLIPDFIGNRIYQFISANRYKWFGKRDICRMPTPEESNRILQ